MLCFANPNEPKMELRIADIILNPIKKLLTRLSNRLTAAQDDTGDWAPFKAG
jgi:hypothetical protein